VDPVPEPVLNLVAPEIEPGASGSVARNSGHWTTEVLIIIIIIIKLLVKY
jgi:hypothetical protein